KMRTDTAKEVRHSLRSVGSVIRYPHSIRATFDYLLHPSQPFLAFRLSMVREWAMQLHQRTRRNLRRRLTKNLSKAISTLQANLTRREFDMLTKGLVEASAGMGRPEVPEPDRSSRATLPPHRTR